MAMYVAFQGTKHVRDWVANLSFRHATMWHDDKAKVCVPFVCIVSACVVMCVCVRVVYVHVQDWVAKLSFHHATMWHDDRATVRCLRVGVLIFAVCYFCMCNTCVCSVGPPIAHSSCSFTHGVHL